MPDDLQNPWNDMQDEFRSMTPRHPPPLPPPHQPTRSGYTDRRMMLVPSWQSAHDTCRAGQQHHTGGTGNKIRNTVIQPKGHGKADQPKGKGYAPKGTGQDTPNGKGNLESSGTNNDDPHDNIVSQDAQDLQDARDEIQRLQYQNKILLRMVDNLQCELMELRQNAG
jgi:hypothetical protein